MLQPLSIRARPAALLLTIGALSVGLSACGSSSSTGTHRSASPKVKKEAVVLGKDVQFTVTNEPSTGGSLRVSVCDATSEGSSADVAVRVAITWDACPEFHNYVLGEGKSAYRTHEAVAGDVRDGADNGFEFYAANPNVGRPYIILHKLETPTYTNDAVSLSEGLTVIKDLAGRRIELWRGEDTDVKVMGIRILR